ncbi:MAG: DUF3187 family protein [Bdellovibrionales bacterium]|nr:DUF3187 family protein [Bdellovibrionales bacterium]
MKLIFVFFCGCIGYLDLVSASKTSFNLSHPLGWMHLLPVGETPGWRGDIWFNFELSESNVWNNKFSATNLSTGKTLSYKSDFEQSSAILDFGFPLAERWSFGSTLAYAGRSGGVLDDFIDHFHVLIGSERFLRNTNSSYGNSLSVETGNVNKVTNPSWYAVGNLKFKLKYWMIKWIGSLNGSCDCGVALSAQIKVPLAQPSSGWTSGHNDYSVLLHLGAPVGEASGIWFTAGITNLGKNELMQDWPMNSWSQMYELSMDLAFTDRWGVILQARAESPFMDRKQLEIIYPSNYTGNLTAYRVSTGWNSLVLWRGSESIGFRWRGLTGQQISFLIVEDWGLGNQDSLSDRRYTNNAPDVSFLTQVYFGY